MNGLLSGVRILAVEQAIAGPYGTMVLADLGAEVIKIEPPEGEAARRLAGPGHRGELFYYLAFNRNKKSVVLDLATASGKKAFYGLVEKCDAVWDNFRPGVMERLGADYETLKKINPKLICCSLSGYGSTGPYIHRPSFDVIVQAISGILSVTGEPGRPPVRPGPPLADMVAGLFAAVGVVSALVRRAETGEGQRLEVSLLDSCVSLLAYHLSFYFCAGIVPGPQGSGHLGLAPYGAFKAKDGYMALGVSWPRVARVIGAEWLSDDPRFSTLEARVKNQNELKAIMEDRLSKASVEQWLALFEAEDMPAGPVQTVDEAARDPQVQHRNMVLSLAHPHGGEVKLAGNPVKAEAIDESRYTAPPTLGQHTDEVLSKLLGYSAEDIARLKREQEEHAAELARHLHKQL